MVGWRTGMDGSLGLLTGWDPGEGIGMSGWVEKLDAVIRTCEWWQVEWV